MEELLFAMVKKTMDQHVLLNLASTIIMCISFDLWMFHSNVNILVFVINLLSDTWVPMHIIVGLFEVNEIIEQSMVVHFSFCWRDLVCCIG
jgi:hypothetical protein